jgi:hypothetical protein
MCLYAAFVGTAASLCAQNVRDGALPARVIGTGDFEFSVPDAAQSARRLRELRRWIADYDHWKRWYETWRNRREPGWVHQRDRRHRPDPPVWLDDACRELAEDQGVLVDACRLLADWKDEPVVTEMRQRMADAQAQREMPTKDMWWEHVHLDALWTMTEVRANVFGVLGMHATVDVAGRFQIFVAPGAILLNLPNGRSREWRPATDWGMAYRMFDFTFPGTDRRASLHLNLARAWVLAGPENLVRSSIDLAGFSVTFKKTAPMTQ